MCKSLPRVSGHLAKNCPVWLGKGARVHLRFPDPAKASGTDDEITAAFRCVRDDIREKIPALLRQHEPPEE